MLKCVRIALKQNQDINKAKSILRNKNKTNNWDLRAILGTMNHDVKGDFIRLLRNGIILLMVSPTVRSSFSFQPH